MVELILENIHIKYDDFLAVQGIDLTINDSEIVTLLGPSGCGKTSILRAIAGFNIPSAGKIFLDGNDITNLPPQKRDMGMIFQNYALWPHMTVEANIGYGLKIRKVAKQERKKITMDLVKQVKLVGHDQKYPTQLSGGQQQRVALARALAISPTVLLCDEPLSNLDFQLRVELRTEIREIAKDVGVTVVYVTHDQTEALAISDRIAIIDEGKLIQEDTPLQIFTNPNSLFVANFVGENNSLKGTIASTDGPVRIKLNSGEVLDTSIPKTDFPLGTHVDLVTRFNELNFEPSKNHNKVTGEVKHLAFMGDFLQAELTLKDSTSFTININENIDEYSKLGKGSLVSVQIPSSSLFIFKDQIRLRETDTVESNVVGEKFSSPESLQQCPKCDEFQSLLIRQCTNCGTELETCQICKRGYKSNEKNFSCPSCDSLFHPDHLREVLDKTGVCPVCKSKIELNDS